MDNKNLNEQIKVTRTESQIRAEKKYEEKNRVMRNEKRRINNNLKYANDPNYREKEYFFKKNNPYENIKV